ncbi:hypothetical protein PFNF135_02290 [Plasmodium falciparum NF135/5.C10]|uniref:Uncharacterized protein n=2 Tax=Plasmodium falciparum TaxID=5833 RepID=A0A024XA06_PLAFC|nr:hypothetical protein PFNF135_02290 [Plasmodium falciparum NF135/5.C10]ETW62033.1 hypothetical protein PFMC_02133 [Plasmodium falciparum CAMP/Malaysia]
MDKQKIYNLKAYKKKCIYIYKILPITTVQIKSAVYINKYY